MLSIPSSGPLRARAHDEWQDDDNSNEMEHKPKRAPRTVIASYKDDQLLFSSPMALTRVAATARLYPKCRFCCSGSVLWTDSIWTGRLHFARVQRRVIKYPSDGQLSQVTTNFWCSINGSSRGSEPATESRYLDSILIVHIDYNGMLALCLL